MSSSWKPSDKERRAILFLEALGLLHDLGKLSDNFLNSRVSYAYKLLVNPRQVYMPPIPSVDDKAIDILIDWWKESKGYAPFKERADMTAKFRSASFVWWDNKQYHLAELILLTRPGEKIQTANWSYVFGKNMHPALLVGRIHGIAHYEKEDAPPENRQEYKATYRATPFGLEHRIPVEKEGLSKALKNLPLDQVEEIAKDKRRTWLGELKKLMLLGIADTRRPQNDVTLWEWGYCVASLTKAAAAWIFKNKKRPKNLNKLAWCTLRVNLDILGLYARSDRISDLLGIRATLDASYHGLKKLLEENYAVANLFYHDETGAYYLFPDFELGDDLRQSIQNCFPLDLQPLVHLEEEPVRGGQLDRKYQQTYDERAVNRLLADPRKKAIQIRQAPVLADNNLYPWEEEWTKKRPPNTEICTVCGFRPVGYPLPGSEDEEKLNLQTWAEHEKAKARSVCRVCLDRRGRRCEEWAQEGLQGTIWTSEVADNYGRLALLVGCLDLDGWLDGTLLSTIPIDSSDDKWFTKSPSPARLYRIAETARSFWQQIIERITPDTVGQRPFRLEIHPADSYLSTLKDKLGLFHAYEIDLEGLTLEAVWDGEKFITAENLGYFARRHDLLAEKLPEYLRGRAVKLKERPELGKPIHEVATARIAKSKKLNGYNPTIPLMAEPGVCMVLIPADKALALVREVKKHFELQFGRVRDRLPMHLGLVFFKRRTPIRAVLEAGQAILKMGGKWVWENWDISEVQDVNRERKLTFENGIIWHVPIFMNDGTPKDDWYPYLLLKRPDSGGLVERQDLVHVCQLNKGLQVFIRPSRFDFEFLDTTGRRFEISYDSEGRRRQRRTRPFLLDDLDRFNEIWDQMKNLALSQRYQVIQSIEATRESWFGRDEQNQSGGDPVFKQFVKDTLAGAAWGDHPWEKIDEKVREKMVRAGVTGELADLAELHMEIMKEK